MTDQPRTAQGWAWDYLRNRLRAIMGLLELSENENLPKVFTFTDPKEGELFIRFPKLEVENDELVFKNTELYIKIGPVKKMNGSGVCYSAIRVLTGSLHEIPNNEPVIVVK